MSHGVDFAEHFFTMKILKFTEILNENKFPGKLSKVILCNIVGGNAYP